MDEEFAASHGLSRTPLKQKYELEVFDGADGGLSGAVTDLVVGEMVIDQHTETQASFFLAKLGHYPIVLGNPWLRKHDVTTRWQQNSLSLLSSYFQDHCLFPSRAVASNQDRSYSHLNSIVPLAGVEFSSSYGPGMDCHKNTGFVPTSQLVGAAPLLSLARENNTQVFSVSSRDIEKALAPKVGIEIHTDEVYKYKYKGKYHLSRALTSCNPKGQRFKWKRRFESSLQTPVALHSKLAIIPSKEDNKKKLSP